MSLLLKLPIKNVTFLTPPTTRAVNGGTEYYAVVQLSYSNATKLVIDRAMTVIGNVFTIVTTRKYVDQFGNINQVTDTQTATMQPKAPDGSVQGQVNKTVNGVTSPYAAVKLKFVPPNSFAGITDPTKLLTAMLQRRKVM
jgi:hypothetical protein